MSDIAFVDRLCPMCGSTDTSRVYAASNFDPSRLSAMTFASRKLPEYMHHRLLECPTCAMVYSSPVPREESFEEGYEQADFSSSEESRFAAQTYAHYLTPLVPRLPSKQWALDIGAGDGTMVAELVRLGFENIIGVEPSAEPIRQADPAIAPMLRQAFFKGDDYEAGSFDLITCFQTIEHVPDPAQLVRDALRLLRPGGALAIVCHNLNAMSAKILGERSPIFDVAHLQLFSKTTITRLYERAGYERVSANAIMNRYPIRYYARLMPMPKSIKGRAVAGLNKAAVGGILVPAPLGNLCVVGFQPKKT